MHLKNGPRQKTRGKNISFWMSLVESLGFNKQIVTDMKRNEVISDIWRKI